MISTRLTAYVKTTALVLLHPVYMWLFRKVVSRACKIHPLVAVIAATRLRLHFDLPLVGEDEALDAKLGDAVLRFFDWSFEEGPSVDSNDQFAQWLQQDLVANDDRETYYRVSYWLYSDTDRGGQIASAHRGRYGREIESIDESSIWKTYLDLRARLRVDQRMLRKSKARLLEISLKDITPLVPWISILLIVGGYLHITVLYRHFGIDPGNFFLVSDYISSSIEELRHSVTGSIAYLLGVAFHHRNEPTITKYEYEQRRRRERWGILFFWGTSVIFLAAVYNESWFPHITLVTVPNSTIVAIYGAVFFPIGFVSSRYFKKSVTVFAVSMLFVLFFASLLVTTYKKIEDIENGEASRNFEIEVGSKQYTGDNARLIGSNARFVFLLSVDERIEVIPVTRISRFRLARE